MLTDTFIVQVQKLLNSDFVAWLDSNFQTHNLFRKEVSVGLGWEGTYYLGKYPQETELWVQLESKNQ